MSLTSGDTRIHVLTHTPADCSNTHRTLFFLSSEVLCLANGTNKYKHMGM